MAETNLFMHLLVFGGALWWTKNWLIDRPASRWRYLLAAMASIPMWIVSAYTATRAVSGSSGVGIVYASLPIAYLSAVMAFVSVIGLILGLYLWAEEEAEDAAEELPRNVSTGFGD